MPPEASLPGAGPRTEGERSQDPIEKIAESFVERWQRGERPTIQEYVDKHPDLAREIRAILPTLLLMEEMAGPSAGERSGAAAPAPAVEPAAGASSLQLGEYRILREIGRGGMGVVYEAIQETLGRRVALKILPPRSFKDPGRVERFLREARAAARLHHTNIVPIFGVGEEAGTHYYAMQFIRGQGLDQVLRELKRLRAPGEDGAAGGAGRGGVAETDLAAASARSLLSEETAALPEAAGVPPSPAALASAGDGSSSHLLTGDAGSSRTHRSHAIYFRNVARLGLQVAEALAYAHGEGILHRDIKPSNLLLDTQGTAWITDFGLAKAEGSDELTQTGDLVGTLRYMAPERFKGWSDVRSDVYGLGLTLYELVTLKAAFPDTRRSNLVRRVLEESPARPRRIDPQVPRDLETIVLKAVEKEPGRRYGSAGEMAADLRRYLAGEPIRARAVGNLERAWRWCLRNPAWTGLLISIVLLLLTVAGISTVYSLKLTERNREAQRNLRAAYLEEARALRYGGRSGRRFKALEAIRNAAALHASPELRDEAVACLALQDVRVEKSWSEPARDHLVLAFDSRVERFAIAPGRGRQGIAIRRVLDGAELGYLDAGGANWVRLELSPDDRFLAEVFLGEGGHRLRLWDIASGARVLNDLVPADPEALDFASDPPWIAVGQADGQLLVRDLETGEVVGRISPGVEMKAIAFHPEGRLIAVSGSRDGRVQVFDLGTGEPVAGRELRPTRAEALAFSPGGELLAAACLDARTYLYETDTWRVAAVLEGHENAVLSCTFSREGDFLATTSWDGTTRFWEAWTGRCFLSVMGFCRGRFSRDDRRLGFHRSASDWGVWEVATGRELRTLGRQAGMNTATCGLDFSPDGRLLAFVTDQGWGLWDLEAGRRAAFVIGQFDRSILFEPDGGGLIVSGDGGVRRFPITRQGTRLRLGPPALLSDGMNYAEISLSQDGRRLVVAEDVYQGSLVFERAESWTRTAFLPHAWARFVALSPTGRWAATGTWHASGVKVWDAAGGRQIAELPVEYSAMVRFSPDERWLVSSSTSEYCFWSTDTWSPVPVRRMPLGGGFGPSCMAFSPDGGILAIHRGQTHVELLDPATGELVVRLELPGLGAGTGPGFGSMGCLGFSRDGSLFAAGLRRSILIWDLRRIREEIRPLGLDWNAAPFPPQPPRERGPLLRVEIDPGPRQVSTLAERWSRAMALLQGMPELHRRIRENPRDLGLLLQRASLHQELSQWKAAIADYEKCFEIEPGNERALNALAWLLVTAPPEFRKPARAVALASECLTRAGDRHLVQNTLGVACYRLGRYDEAVKHLLESNRHSTEAERPYNEFCLALSHHRLGNGQLAEWYVRRARESCASLRELRRDLESIRAEAEEVLGR